MRQFSNDIITKSEQTNQTIAAESEPYVSLRISRKRTILDNMDLAEKVKVRKLDANAITDGDVAVCHPRFKGENTKIWCCYLDEGKLRVRWVYDQENITEQKWTVVHAGAPDAIACAICFDSEVVENARGIAEFVTGSENPLIFYVTPEGALICLTLGGTIIEETLAGENVTDVTAVRGPSSKNGGWDLGVTVFFLMGGSLFYRQLINGVWYDAEQVSLGITGETIVKIDAFNTWDYRVGVQCLTQSGKLYQLLTYTEGIGVRGTEHIEMKMSAQVELSGIDYYTEFMTEHIAMTMNAAVQMLYGLSAVPVLVQNVQDSDQNYGTTIEVTFDVPCTDAGIDPSMFGLTDSLDNIYYCDSCTLVTGYVLRLVFDDFNLAQKWTDNSLTLTYTKPSTGGILSPATQTNSFTENFTPTGLVAPLIDPPTFSSASNDSAGMVITLNLTEEATNTSVTAMASHFSVSLQEYDYVPSGSLVTNTRTVASVAYGITNDILILTLNTPNISNAIGDVTVIYDGLGGLKGRGGPSTAFSGTFTPSGLTWKGNQNDVEHISMSMTQTVQLKPIVYHDTQSTEHIAMNMTAGITLIDIHDL